MSENNEPETLAVRWLSHGQSFSMIGKIVETKDSDFFKYQQAMEDEDGEEKAIVAINLQPIAGAVAVHYPHINSFSVFIGVSSQGKEESDIAYIKIMGQRQPAYVGRALFPEYAEMAYRN